MKCNVKGHDHDVVVVERLTQQGTGQKAVVVECPSGYYRWLVVGDRDTLPESTRMKRPRFGWRR